MGEHLTKKQALNELARYYPYSPKQIEKHLDYKAATGNDLHLPSLFERG